jgi:hypothetical protein
VPLAPIVWLAPFVLLARFDEDGGVGSWLRRRVSVLAAPDRARPTAR